LAAPDISFKPALEALRMQRRVPTFSHDLTIGGGIEQAVHSELDRQRERRISAMEMRLSESRSHFESVFALAQLQTRACRDFERSR
jgi:hypothetical protein